MFKVFLSILTVTVATFAQSYFSEIHDNSLVLDNCDSELKVIISRTTGKDTAEISGDEVVLNLPYIAQAIKKGLTKSQMQMIFPEQVREVAKNFDKYNKKLTFRWALSKVFVKKTSEGVAFAQ